MSKENRITAVLGLLLLALPASVLAAGINERLSTLNISAQVKEWMEEGRIPGLTVVMVTQDQSVILNFGYADVEAGKQVGPHTLFELGAGNHAFTALAVLRLVKDGKLQLNASVKEYIPGFSARYKGQAADITIRQLLYHSSGMAGKTPWEAGNTDMELKRPPGKEYAYAAVNYEILALVIRAVSGMPFEQYLEKNVFDALGLESTMLGTPREDTGMCRGYKTGFFRPRAYEVPLYKGGNPQNYVTSNGEDMARWLKFQLGNHATELYHLARAMQQRDETVPPHGLVSGGMGWNVSLSGNGEVYQAGLSPNFSSYIGFRAGAGIGVAVLANSNSGYTQVIGANILKLLAGERVVYEADPADGHDKSFSIIAIMLACYLAMVIAFLVKVTIDVCKGKRRYERLNRARVSNLLIAVLPAVPMLGGIYLFPAALMGTGWEQALIWAPVSFPVAVVLLLAAIFLSLFAFLITLLFPEKNYFMRKAPLIVLMSVLSGVANMVIVLLITSSLKKEVELKYLVFYFGLTLMIYLMGRRIVQVSRIMVSRELIFDLQIRLIDKIFSTSYERFEKIDRGRLYTSLSDDVAILGNATNVLIRMMTNVIATLGVFLFLASLAFWATFITVALVGVIFSVYYMVTKSTTHAFEEARDSRNVFMKLVSGMIDGFKELSLHRNKKLRYKEDVELVAGIFRDKTSFADIRFANAYVAGETLQVVILGVIAFAIPRMFSSIHSYTLLSFIMLFLYLMGPINGILVSIPTAMRIRVSWKRFQQLLKEVPANLDMQLPPPVVKPGIVNSIRVEGVKYHYQGEGKEGFSVGPLNLEVKKGEILFITGGNGSGKTTLVKLLSGLYGPNEGKVLINGVEVGKGQIGEYFSAVFSPCYLFEKLYNIDAGSMPADAAKYMELLGLTEKVEIRNNRYSTINLSGGQRKRLALLQCYLESSPIYLFDEWAADQDPEYRRFFYKMLLPEMRRKGKIIIAVTHDEQYFHVADKVLKMDKGTAIFFPAPASVLLNPEE